MRHIHTILFSLLVLGGCASKTNSSEINYDEIFQKGKTALEKKKYIKSQEFFNTVVIGASHTDLGDDALFYLGESYFLNKEYILASAEFNKLIRRMQFSPFVETARYRICESFLAESPKYYHDQDYTEKSLDKFQEFLDDYPTSEKNAEIQITINALRYKLAQKAYETGILYIKLHEFQSAIIAFSNVTDTYYDTEFNLKAHLNVIRCHLELRHVDEAREYYEKYALMTDFESWSETIELWLSEGKFSAVKGLR